MKIGTITPYRQFCQNFQAQGKYNHTFNSTLMCDTVSFGKKSSEETPDETKPKKKRHFAPKALKALLGAYAVFAAIVGTRGMVDEAEKIIEAKKLMMDFKENPAEVAEAFIEDFALNETFTNKDGSTSYVYSTRQDGSDSTSRYSSAGSSVIFTYNGENGLQSAALDLDSDDNPEIIVKPAKDGYKVFYDFNSDGKIDFTSAEEGEIEQ